jgi:gliding motility-associated-like protein
MALGQQDLWAQPAYNMSSQTVTDCYGILFDSDAGQVSGNYGHNEDFTFVICPPNAASVTLTFFAFCTEPVFDVLRVFDGPDTFSTLLGTYHGSLIPPTLTASSGCMTIHFKSDANNSCTGWEAHWSVTLNPPIPPVVSALTNLSCTSPTFHMVLDQPIPCDSAYPASFILTGPGNPQVVSVTPVGCSGGTTNTFAIGLSPGFSDNGNHTLTFVYRYLDHCDSLWEFTIVHNFQVTDCPLFAAISAIPIPFARGNVPSLRHRASGGDPSTYAYAWSHGIPPGPGPHNVCPVSTTTYSVTVTDAGPSPAAIATRTITVLPRPNAGANQSICQFSNPITLTGSPLGGTWSGPGITDPAGTFHPDTAGVGIHQVVYTRNGCADTKQVEVRPVWAGFDDAACPGAAPFTVSGGQPAGGSWSGPNINAAGLFTPNTPGSYPVTYTAPNGCSHTKSVHVDNLWLPPNDTTCTSRDFYFAPHSPPGGIWSGPGIVNPNTGEFRPTSVGAGDYPLVYTLQGCSDTIWVNVKQIQVPNSRVYCPSQGVVALPPGNPTGGYWTGIGVVDSTGLFNAMHNNGNNFTVWLVYHFDGCVDSMRVFVRRTVIQVPQVEFCQTDSRMILDFNTTGRSPGGGIWSGPGVIHPWFYPTNAGPGTHTIYYTLNTCTDSMTMLVHPKPVAQADTTVCISGAPFNLQAQPAGGSWSGTGITDPNTGNFNPATAGLGTFEIVYDYLLGCRDTMTVSVVPLATINISRPASFFCFRDTLVPLVASPPGGTWSGNGVVGSNFHPVTAGAGNHLIRYDYGSGDCAVFDTFSITVGPPIQVVTTFTADSICFGDYAQLEASASGGSTGNFTFVWSHGLGDGPEKTVNPVSTTVYTVVATDGCSRPEQAQVTVFVHPDITATITGSDSVCYGDTGWVAVTAPLGRQYIYNWQGFPGLSGDTLYNVRGNYPVTLTDVVSGCANTVQAPIVGYPYLRANFTRNPNQECISSLDATFTFMDNSTGGTTGYWDMGDGNTIPYVPFNQPTYTYLDTGRFMVTLYLENDGGCTDTFSLPVCIRAEATLWVPTAFTPNGDGINDVFRAAGIGITEFRMMVFSRWGEKLFESNDIEDGWDGTYGGSPVQNDAYTYLIIYRDITSDKPKQAKGVVGVVR